MESLSNPQAEIVPPFPPDGESKQSAGKGSPAFPAFPGKHVLVLHNVELLGRCQTQPGPNLKGRRQWPLIPAASHHPAKVHCIALSASFSFPTDPTSHRLAHTCDRTTDCRSSTQQGSAYGASPSSSLSPALVMLRAPPPGEAPGTAGRLRPLIAAGRSLHTAAGQGEKCIRRTLNTGGHWFAPV